MRPIELVTAVVFGTMVVTPPRGAAAPGGTLHDNGPPDNSNAYSNATVEVFGARRTLLDDFTIPEGLGWLIRELGWQHVWNTLPPGSGTGVELLFRADDEGAPGDPVTPLATVTSYDERSAGVTYFGRPSAISWARRGAERGREREPHPRRVRAGSALTSRRAG